MDDGTTTDAAYQLGDHTLGRPFVKFKPDRNVFEVLPLTVHCSGRF